jgi:UDP-N-acetylglucosamine 2-epimerase (non-hydrolysing)
MKTAIILGTRPEIIKLAPIITKLRTTQTNIIFTGQHYDHDMSLQFIKQLELPKPDFWLKLTKNNPSIQMGEIIIKLSTILKRLSPDTMIVQGDTNTVFAASVAGIKSGIPISHVESGLRSYDWRMPEEHNRIATDHISELLFAPTRHAQTTLKSENVHGKIFVTGNTVIDSINHYSKFSSKKSSLELKIDDYILMTLHRAENVDNKKTLSSIIKAIIKSKKEIIFPLHPRTFKKLKEFDLYYKLKNTKNIHLLNSVGYFEILELMKNCSFILSDSGGIQEEATASSIRKKVLVLRKTTDRPESLENGFSKIIGTKESSILSNINKTVDNPKIKSKKSPFGNGHASDKIIKILKTNF